MSIANRLLPCICSLLAWIGTANAGELWSQQRGGPAGRAAIDWYAAKDERLREWHYLGKGSRRYKPGLATWGSPALALVDGRPLCFIGGADNTLHALDLLSKQRIWFKITNAEIGDAPAVGLVDGLPVVAWASNDRSVYCHFVRTGERLWSREIIPPSSTLGDARLSAPLLHDGRLYLTAFAYDRALARNRQQAFLVCLDLAYGEILWKAQVASGPVNAPTGADLGDTFLLYVPARKGLLQAFTLGPDGTPRLRWTHQMSHEVFGSVVIDPDAPDPSCYLGSKFGEFLALDARTGEVRWKQMAGNWVDNSACAATVGGERMVFVGSHDYSVHAFRAADGFRLWQRRLGGEVYTAPCFFETDEGPRLAVAALDDHLYILDAASGRVTTSFYTDQPMWDKIAKGETLWASPVAVSAGKRSAVIHGSYSGTLLVLPLEGEVALRTKVRRATDLWIWLGVVAALFLGGVLPAVLLLGRRRDRT